MAGGASTVNSRIVKASPERVYEAFIDRDDLLAWLPPGEMTGQLHEFDARVGRGYQMSLFYPPDETAFRGKFADREDRVNVRFVELSPPRRIVEAITFDTSDPTFMGEMTMTVTLDEVPGGTNVIMLFENLPPGLRPEDNEVGAEMSLDQLARHLE
jgi:uncharacterized protein YndB with AHSA1/START domain